MDIIYHIADFQKNILIVLTAFPLELKKGRVKIEAIENHGKGVFGLPNANVSM